MTDDEFTLEQTIEMHWRRLLPLVPIVLAASTLIGWGVWTRIRSGDELASIADSSPEEKFQYALAALKRGDGETVQSIIRMLQSEPGYEQHAGFLQAAYLVGAGRTEAGLSALAAIPPSEDLRSLVQIWMTKALYRLHRLSEAEAVVRRLLDREPDNAEAHRWLASIYWDLGANGAAAPELRHVIRLDSKDSRPWHLLGIISFDAENYTEAIGQFRNALSRNPPPQKRLDIVRRLARCLVKTRRYREALKLDAEEGLSDATMLALAGEAHWALGRPKKTRELLNRAGVIEPENRFVLMLDAQLEMQSGDPGKAVPLLKKQLQRDPHDFEARYRLAMCYRKLKKTAHYKEAITRAESSQALRKQLSELSNLAVRQPRNAKVREQLEDVCRQLGKTKLAETYRRAAEACRRASP